MIYGSVCSGIEAASVAWHTLGWRPAFFSEIDKFPRAVLRHHFPEVPLHGDFTTIQGGEYEPVDLLVGGTPCQDFSVAGLRKGLAGERGNLTLEYLKLAGRLRPRWLAWENVPGVLSQDGGRAFGAFLGGLAELGYGFAWRVLDAQYVRVDGLGRAVPQRRRRVFVVGYLGDWRRAAAVLFERASLCGDPPPRREAREGVAGTIAAGAGKRGQPEGECGQLIYSPEIMAQALTCHIAKGSSGPSGDEHHHLIAFSAKDYCADATEGVSPTLRAGGHTTSHANAGVMPAVAFKASHFTRGKDGAPDVVTPPLSADADKGDQDTLIAFDTTQLTSPNNRSRYAPGEPCHALSAQAHPPTLAYAIQGAAGRENPASGPDGVGVRSDGAAYTLEARAEVQAVAAPYTLAVRGRGDSHNLEFRQDGTANAILTPNGGRAGIGVGAIATAWAVRRLTPRECERLQGFPDDFTLIPVGKRMAADGPRYKALGNSMAVNVMRWIGQRIDLVERMDNQFGAAA